MTVGKGTMVVLMLDAAAVVAVQARSVLAVQVAATAAQDRQVQFQVHL
jgi:hypothetical protein